MPLTKTALYAALDTIKHPLTGKGLLVSDGLSRCQIVPGEGGNVDVLLGVAPGSMSAGQIETLRRDVGEAAKGAAQRAGVSIGKIDVVVVDGVAGGGGAQVAASLPQVGKPAASAQPAGMAKPGPAPGGTGSNLQASAQAMPGVKRIIAVGAGKGGVGKSTIAVNLAVGLALRGHSVGLLDGDIYGPSLPTMLGLDSMQANLLGNMLQPFYVHGVKAMTIGKLVEPEKPLIWRGPMAHGAFKQLVEQTQWGELDYLIIDLPPGTGDVALTMAQLLRLDGAVVVCTPQQVAQDDAIRALRMFQQLGIEVLGVVENMSYFVADDIPASQGGPREYDIFGRGGAQMMAQRTGVPFLGSVPITISLRKNCDEGDPSANFKGSTAIAKSLDGLVHALEGQVALAGLRSGNSRPTLTVS